MSQKKAVSQFIQSFSSCKRRDIIDNGLDIKKDLKLMSKVYKCMHKKIKHYFDYLFYLLNKVIGLRVISGTIEQFYFQPFEKHYLKLTKEFWVMINYQVIVNTPINKVKPDKESISLFFSCKNISSFNQSNFFREFVYNKYQSVVSFITQKQNKNKIQYWSEKKYWQ